MHGRPGSDAAVDLMAAAMRNELAANDSKGDWSGEDPAAHAWEAIYHACKMALAVRFGHPPAVLEYAADVANHALMCADCAGALAAPLNPGHAEFPGIEDGGEYDGQGVPWGAVLPALKAQLDAWRGDLLDLAHAAELGAAP